MTAALTRSEARLQREITAAIAASAELESILVSIVRAGARLCRAPLAMITLLSEDGRELEVAAVFGTNAPVLGARLPVAASFNGVVITTGRSVCSSDVLRDPRPKVRRIPQESGARGVLVVPLKNQHGPFGTLGVAKRMAWRFTRRDEELLAHLADNASIAIQNARLRQHLHNAEPHPGEPNVIASRPTGISEDPEGSAASRARSHRLSPREGQILNLVMAGKTCKEVASTLNISGRTVQHYLERLKLRFDQPRLPALVGYVVRHGICASPVKMRAKAP